MADADTGTAPIAVDVIADLACPWCYIGKRRLDEARRMRPHRPVRLRWWPFFLNPFLPPEGMDRATYVRTKFGGDAAARRVYERIEDAGRSDGIAFAFERMTRTPNTALAHRLILFAEARSQAEPLIERLFAALFVEGRDIGRREVLVEIAGQCGFDEAEVEAFLADDRLAGEVAQWHQQAERIGVRGVPVFVFDGEHAISGAQPGEVLAGLLDVAATPERARA